ncbi:MAG: hypothetical protein ACTSX7_19705 [Alphaproteobacteria bacterium]
MFNVSKQSPRRRSVILPCSLPPALLAGFQIYRDGLRKPQSSAEKSCGKKKMTLFGTPSHKPSVPDGRRLSVTFNLIRFCAGAFFVIVDPNHENLVADSQQHGAEEQTNNTSLYHASVREARYEDRTYNLEA